MVEPSDPGSQPEPSKRRPPAIVLPPKADSLTPGPLSVRVRTPTRTSTHDHEVELGVYLGPKQTGGTPGLVSPSKLGFSVSESASASGSQALKSLFLSGSEWRTDIVTFCSHVRLGSTFGEARITHVQARKSRRPPFLHEYILVFFTTAHGQRFVARVDRLGKVGSSSGGGLLPGWCRGRKGPAANTAVQQVEVYEIQDSQMGIDSPDGPWCARDGGWGSYPIATLVGWSEVRSTTQVSHHTTTAAAVARDGRVPRLADISRLLEAILLEMPTYHLTTTNCYFMTRSSLLLFLRCFPDSFACFLGSSSGKLVTSSALAEPVWAGLLYWYLPFVIVSMLLYLPLVFMAQSLASVLICQHIQQCSSRNHLNYLPLSTPWLMTWQAVRVGFHGLVDIPLPIGILHAWMTALEIKMNGLVIRLSTEYQRLERGGSEGEPTTSEAIQPFGVPFQHAWHVLAIWCCIGLLIAVAMFLSLIINTWFLVAVFAILLVVCVAFNLSTSDGDILEAAEDMFNEPGWDGAIVESSPPYQGPPSSVS